MGRKNNSLGLKNGAYLPGFASAAKSAARTQQFAALRTARG
jgi:hypothetical protein